MAVTGFGPDCRQKMNETRMAQKRKMMRNQERGLQDQERNSTGMIQ